MNSVPDGQPSHDEHSVRDAVRGAVPSRRFLLRSAGVGLVGAVSASAAARAATDLDTSAARVRADGAAVTELPRATSLRVLWRARTDQKVMALTFDDGPGETLTAPLLEVLRAAKVRATFCLVGRRAHEQRDLVREQMRGGHELANHTWTHPDLGLLDFANVKKELERTDQLLYELTGRRPAVIRPPYGHVSGELLQYAGATGQAVVLWSLRFQESTMNSAQNAAYLIQHLRPGSVLLGHDAGSANRYVGTQAVPALIRGARARGYEFVTASEMLELDTAADAKAAQEASAAEPPTPAPA